MDGIWEPSYWSLSLQHRDGTGSTNMHRIMLHSWNVSPWRQPRVTRTFNFCSWRNDSQKAIAWCENCGIEDTTPRSIWPREVYGESHLLYQDVFAPSAAHWQKLSWWNRRVGHFQNEQIRNTAVWTVFPRNCTDIISTTVGSPVLAKCKKVWKSFLKVWMYWIQMNLCVNDYFIDDTWLLPSKSKFKTSCKNIFFSLLALHLANLFILRYGIIFYRHNHNFTSVADYSWALYPLLKISFVYHRYEVIDTDISKAVVDSVCRQMIYLAEELIELCHKKIYEVESQ